MRNFYNRNYAHIKAKVKAYTNYKDKPRLLQRIQKMFEEQMNIPQDAVVDFPY